MNVPDTFRCRLTVRFDPWGYADDPVLDVLLPLPADDGYQVVRDLRAPAGTDIRDDGGHRRLIRLDRGAAARITAKIETRRLRPGDHLSLSPPGPEDCRPGPMTAPDGALQALANRSVDGLEDPAARIAALAHAAAGALRYRYPRDSRGAALSLARGWGDCGEYAFVFVALCHAAAIPARPVFGLITAPWMQTPHAWAEAWDGAGWCPVDPNFVREGACLGPLVETQGGAEHHIGGLDPYRVALSRHTGLPWPGEAADRSGEARQLTLTVEGLGEVTFWHETPRWDGAPVVPFLQMPWTVIRQPAPATPGRRLRRLRAWRFAVQEPSRRLPRHPLVWADIVALHPTKGVVAVMAITLAGSLAPGLSPVVQTAVWLWVGVLGIGMLRGLRLIRLRWFPSTAGHGVLRRSRHS